ncbi:MAG: PLP-dependent transferase [Fuerstiella sp.]|nr:PLP-dependent transferase [Fuerstiella sp.]
MKIETQCLNGMDGSMVVYGINGVPGAGSKFIETIKLFSSLANIGEAKNSAMHPASTKPSQLNEQQQMACGIRPEMIRLSVASSTPTTSLRIFIGH